MIVRVATQGLAQELCVMDRVKDTVIRFFTMLMVVVSLTAGLVFLAYDAPDYFCAALIAQLLPHPLYTVLRY